MDKVKAFFSAVIEKIKANPKISAAIGIGIALVICGIVFGAKLQGCIDKM